MWKRFLNHFRKLLMPVPVWHVYWELLHYLLLALQNTFVNYYIMKVNYKRVGFHDTMQIREVADGKYCLMRSFGITARHKHNQNT